MFIDKNIIGQKFNRLTAIEFSYKKGHGLYFWLFKCDCGIEKIINKYDVENNITKSCGCYKSETMKIKMFGNKYGLNSHANKGKYRTAPEEAGFNLLLKVYNDGAKKRNLEFLLTIEEFKKLTKENCHYCNCEPKTISRVRGKSTKDAKDRGQYIFNGIDRVNNSNGYLLENCVTCCKLCNQMKLDMSYEDFMQHIKNINNFRGSK